MTRHIFHLAIPVEDLIASETFYCSALGGVVGRRNQKWIDILIWGHQITLHDRPDEVPARDSRGVRHFGAVLPWDEWEHMASSIESRGFTFLSPPAVSEAGSPREAGKFLLEDPSGNVIELKAYRDFEAAFSRED